MENDKKVSDYSNPEGIERVWKNARKFLKPPPKLTPAEYAEANVKIPLGNAIAGYIRFSNAPYQIEPLNIVADPDVRKITLMWGAQVGKALDVDTPILTPNGFKRMGDLQKGDTVYDENGEPCNVTFATEYQHNRQCYKVEFDDGSYLIADADHNWSVIDKGYKVRGVLKPVEKVMTTKEMIEPTAMANKRGRTRYAIRNTKPVELPHRALPVNPYIVGYWLGDGETGTSYIHSSHDDFDELSTIIPINTGATIEYMSSDKRGSDAMRSKISVGGNSLIKLLNDNNISKDNIPDEYRFSSIEQRKMLLSGLLDSDGHLDKRLRYEFINKRQWLAELVYYLAASIGLKPHIKQVVKGYNGVFGEYSMVTFKAYAEDELCFISRKCITQDKANSRKNETYFRRIKSITPVLTRPVKCIQVDSPNRLYLAGENCVPTHNTQLINCALAYNIDQDPKSQIMMQPSEGDLRTWLETKFNPMVEECESLNAKIASPRSRDGVNNQQMKSYAGGWLMFSWAGSPRTMRGRSAPMIYCDEVDGYQYNAEGHPVSLLWQRAATFGDQRKLLVTSTPTIKNNSFVESSFQEGDQRYYYIPCPHCEDLIRLHWANVHWDKSPEGEHLPETAFYACQNCGGVITDSQKYAALKKGKWIADKPFRGHASFHLSELYSSFRRWRDIVISFLEKKHTGDLQSFVNVSLAETWEEDGEKIDQHELMDRTEPMATVPEFALFVTAGVDVQDNRLEIQFNAWGRDDEMAVLEQVVIYGDPSTTQLWQNLDSQLLRTWETADGRTIHVRSTCVDSGGHFTNQVYAYCKKNYGRRVFAVKGKGGEGTPLVGKPSKSNIAKCPLFMVGVDTAKDTIFARLNIREQGAGYIHFNDTLGEEFFLQLTAEKIVTRYQNGFKRRVYEKFRARNEALDCMVYSFCAYAIIGINVNALADKLEHDALNPVIEDPQERINAEKSEKPKKRFVPKARGNNFATSWR